MSWENVLSLQFIKESVGETGSDLSFGDGLIETGRKEETRQLKPSNKDALMVKGISEAGNGKNQVIERPKLDKR